MKYLLFVAVIIFASCESKTDEVCEDLNCDLIGEWAWVSTYGSIAGQTWTPESTGEDKLLVVEDDSLSFYTDGTLTEKLSYEVFESDTIIKDMNYTYCKYGLNTRLVFLEGDDLRFQDLCADCYDDSYTRVK